MPITNTGSYLTTAQLFLAHWSAVNGTLGANPLLLRGTYPLANFTTDRAALQTAITALEPLLADGTPFSAKVSSRYSLGRP